MSAGYPPTGAPPRRHRPGGAVLPLLLILVGVVFLLRNYGLVPPSIWSTLLPFWPLLLILFGVDLLVGGRVGWLTQIGIALVVLGLGAGILVGLQPAASDGAAAQPSSNVEQALQGASRATVHVEYGAGRFETGALNDPGDRLATATLDGGSRIESRYRVRDGAGDLTLDVTGEGRPWFTPPFHGPGRPSTSMDVRLNPAVPLALDAKLGAADSRLDLSALKLSRLDLQTGASSVWVRLPEAAGATSGRIQAGAASLTIEIPAGVAAQIDYQGGISNLDVDETRFPLVGEGSRGGRATVPGPPTPPLPTAGAPAKPPAPPAPPAPPKPGGPPAFLGGSRLYRSPDYDAAANKIDLVVESGASSVTIR